MPESTTQLRYDDSVRVNKRGEAILGTLAGPCADCIHETRNGRLYSDAVWDKVFQSDRVKEFFSAGGILGELNHPADRMETDLEKVAICMPEPPVRNDKGELVTRVDILDTANGRIAATLAKYGYKLGISSRGTGELLEDFDGDKVDPETYELFAFDLVVLPSVKNARLTLVESLNSDSNVKKALREELEKATPDDKRLMESSLKELKINLNDENPSTEAKQEAEVGDTQTDLVKSLQEALIENKKLATQIRSLQENLSVRDVKERQLKNELQKYKSSVITLSEGVRKSQALSSKVKSLEEQLQASQADAEKKSKQISQLNERLKLVKTGSKNLTESLDTSNDDVKKLNEQLEQTKLSYEKQVKGLQADVDALKQNLVESNNEAQQRIRKATKLAEQYKSTATAIANKYIECKATALGVPESAIRKQLNESYTISDIDTACERVRSEKIRFNNLPFSLGKGASVGVKKSVDPISPATGIDDEVTPSLRNLAGM